MSDEQAHLNSQAERDFQRARNQAFWANIWAKLRGDNIELLNFDEVKETLRLRDERYLGLKEIPIDDIVGSVGRYNDFTRRFLPKRSVNSQRWKTVDSLALGMMGFPPIEVYKVGEAYFVVDGNHRVSVARANQMKTIEAYVTEFQTTVPFDRNTQSKDLALKAEYAYFLQKTRLKRICPEAEDILLTETGRYPEILGHIEVHHYFMGLDCLCPVDWTDAVGSWYTHVYQPMISAIREYEMLAGFPNRTEADLYVWLIRHQGEMRANYGDLLSPEETVGDFIEKSGV